MDFITKLENKDITDYGLGKEISELEAMNYDTDSIAQIEWSFSVESRGWGIKDISVLATHVAIEINVNIWSDDDEDDTIKVIKIDTSYGDCDWELETDTSCLEIGHCINPQDLEVDFDNKVITVIY